MNESVDGKRETVRARLSAAREVLLGVLRQVQEEQWEAIIYSDGEEWRISDLLRHLVDSERGMTNLIENFRQGGEGVSADFDLRRWNNRAVSKAKEKGPEALLEEMEANRARLAKVLESLGPDDWEKKGRHGSLRIMTVEEVLALIADHERRHAADIEQTLKG